MRHTVAAWPQLLRAVLTLLMGGALAQLIPLLLGPVLTRLYAPAAFGVFTAFSSVAATVAVVACARYEFALPLARDEGEARTLLVLCLWICGAVALLAVPLAAVLHATGHLPMPALLPLAVAAAGLLQLLLMWATRAQAFRALAIGRVLQYSGAAVLQVLLGWWLWRQAQQPAGADAAWALALGPILASAATAWVLRPHGAPAMPQGQRVSWQQVAVRYRDFPLLNTPHAFLGALQDALAVALLVAWQGGRRRRILGIDFALFESARHTCWRRGFAGAVSAVDTGHARGGPSNGASDHDRDGCFGLRLDERTDAGWAVAVCAGVWP